MVTRCHAISIAIALKQHTKTGHRVVNSMTSKDLSSSLLVGGTKRPNLPFASPDPKARSKLARGDGDSPGLSPTSVQSPPDLARAVYATRTNAGQK